MLIDGKRKGTFDLYAAAEQYNVQFTFAGLPKGKHTIVIYVLGRKNPAATERLVAVDAFIVGAVTTQDTSPKIKYDSWQAKTNPNASGGTYRFSGTENAATSTRASFAASSVTWVTAMGPKYGKAEILIDGFSYRVVDLYAPTKQWQVAKTFNVSSGYYHIIAIVPLHTKNPASSGYKVVMDALIIE